MNNERIVISFKYMFKVNVMKLRNPPEISFPNVSDIPAYLQCSLDLYIIYLSEEKKKILMEKKIQIKSHKRSQWIRCGGK